jgi:hypothetical protein
LEKWGSVGEVPGNFRELLAFPHLHICKITVNRIFVNVKMQQELLLDCWSIGDRLIELPGLPSQRCGVLMEWRPLAGVPDILYPVVLWDSGVLVYSSVSLWLRRLEDGEQLSLPVMTCMD